MTRPNTPKPRDPRQHAVSADEVTRKFEAVMQGDAEDAVGEADMLAQAHEVLHDALRRER